MHLIVFGEQKTNEMVTFVAKNSGGVTKKPMIILKSFFFCFSFNKGRQRLAGMQGSTLK